MNSQIIKFLEGFEKNPAVEAMAIQQIVKAVDFDLPSDYLEIFSLMNGGEGFIGDTYCRLYPLEDLMPLNEMFLVREFAPELFIFGSNGGGEAFAFNTKTTPFSIVEIPFIPMDMKFTKLLGKTIDEFFSHLSTGEKKVSPSIDEALIGKEIHEIQPIVFGGDPLDPKNKIALFPRDYAELVVFWNKMWQDKKGSKPLQKNAA